MNRDLKQTLEKIKALAEQNPEFANELQKIVKHTPSANFALYDDEKISKIERYLGLDYELDSCNSLIDYSGIKDEYVYAQLISDHREMLRYRYGVRSHKIDFKEFCKYAHYQAEMLVNYYLKSSYGDLESFKVSVKRISPKTTISDRITTIEGVSYTSKMFFLKKCNDYYNDNNILEYICWVRNEVNHRTPNSKQELDAKYSEYLAMLRNSGLPLNQRNDDFDWSVLYKDVVKKNMFETQYKNKHSYKESSKSYKFEKFILSQQFNDVIGVLKDLCEVVVLKTNKAL